MSSRSIILWGAQGQAISSRFIIFCSPKRDRPRSFAACVWLPFVRSSASRTRSPSSASTRPRTCSPTSVRWAPLADVGRQVLALDRAVGEHERAADLVLELAHVAGPAVGDEPVHGSAGDARARPARVLLHEARDEDRDVGARSRSGGILTAMIARR